MYVHRSKKLGNLWDDLIYPGMKKAIICSLLSTQDLVEYRKVSNAVCSFALDILASAFLHGVALLVRRAP